MDGEPLRQVEPGNGVTTLKVKDEQIRFVIQNVQCSDRNFSTGRFLSDVTHKEPGLFIKGPGMRWNVSEVNALLNFRCVFLEQSWQTYWKTQGPLAA